MKSAYILALLCFVFNLFSQNKLSVYYFDRPPYYIKGSPVSGFMVEITKMILDEAELNYELIEYPSKRIIEELKQPVNAMSIGWLKNSERELLYKFSDPIYQDSPFIAVCKKKLKKNRFNNSVIIADLLKSDLKLGIVDKFIYGAWLDKNIKAFNPEIDKVTGGSSEQLLRMIQHDRFDYVFMSPEESFTFLYKGKQFADLEEIKISDAPAGNIRYLLFSKDVKNEIIIKINKAIASVKKSDKYKRILKSTVSY